MMLFVRMASFLRINYVMCDRSLAVCSMLDWQAIVFAADLLSE